MSETAPCEGWGAIPRMRCPFGCEPTLTDEQGSRLMQSMFQVGGEV